MFGPKRSVFALVLAAVFGLAMMAPAAASAIVVPSITGTRTLFDGSADNLGGLTVWRVVNGVYTTVNTATVQANANGTYSISGLTDGSYRVGQTALVVGTTAYPGAFYNGAQTLSTASTVTVVGGSTAPGIDLHRAAPGDTLVADAAEPDNDPAQARTLVPGAAPADRTLCGKPDSDWFKFSAVAGRKYSIEASGNALYPVWSSSLAMELSTRPCWSKPCRPPVR